MPADRRQPVLILGAGINGCAVARELLLNGIPVCIVDANDIAWGATSRSSRLIHGGLRYLEYGDFRLVRESLQERSRLRKLAPQFVKPLRLHIPVRRRFAGLCQSAFRFLGGDRISKTRWLAALVPNRSERGLWLVRLGLWFYDRFAWGREFPKHRVVRAGSGDGPAVDADYRWLCGYTDAQMRYPERFVLALLEDARRLAAEHGLEFSVFTYHHVALDGTYARVEQRSDGCVSSKFDPSLVINSTGAWGDLTLAELGMSSPPLFGGTKGSHLVSFEPRLRAALGDDGVYAETSDGRLIFVLPFGDSVLVGTTDERFSGPPDDAIATEQELDYLIGMINHLFPQLTFTRGHVHMHYAGVRPLPASVAGKTSSITRDHFIETHSRGPLAVWTLVGGKLTTARALAEQVAQR
ncbi:MAG: FAD-dependent oxidoreductase, partial [Planctomycetaceae bacterium]